MPDDRYLDGDPNEPVPHYQIDLGNFVLQTQQELQLLRDLLHAGRLGEVEEIAFGRQYRAEQILQTLELGKLPAVDIDRTEDIHRRRTWRFKEGR